MIELSIVTGTVDRPKQLFNFVESIYKNTGISFELIILDASQHHTIEYPELKNLTIIKEPIKLGYAKGFNVGFKKSKGRYVTFLNDDVEVEKDWGRIAVEFMDKSPWCGLGCIYYSELGGEYKINNWLNLPYANFGIISKNLGDKIGWFDEFIYTYGADNSLTFKVLLEGYGIGGVIGSKVRHNPIMDNNKIENIERQPEDCRLLLQKYRPLLPQMYTIQQRYPKSPEYIK